MALRVIADRHTLDAAHQRSRAAAGQWLRGAAHARANAALADAAATAEAIAERVADLIGDDSWVSAMLDPLVEWLAADAFFQPSFRVNRDGLRIGAVLFDHPTVSISAAILSADVLAVVPPPRTVVVPGRLSVVRYWRAGGATLRLWQAERAAADFSILGALPCRPAAPVRLSDGMVVTIDGRTHAQLIDTPLSDVVTITATIRVDADPFMREYAIDDGTISCVAALDDRGPRAQMLFALLRHAGRGDAGDSLADATHDPAYFVRWAAMREWLAIDAAQALPRLREMTGDANAEVRAAATEMVARVDAALMQRAEPCPV